MVKSFILKKYNDWFDNQEPALQKDEQILPILKSLNCRNTKPCMKDGLLMCNIIQRRKQRLFNSDTTQQESQKQLQMPKT